MDILLYKLELVDITVIIIVLKIILIFVNFAANHFSESGSRKYP